MMTLLLHQEEEEEQKSNGSKSTKQNKSPVKKKRGDGDGDEDLDGLVSGAAALCLVVNDDVDMSSSESAFSVRVATFNVHCFCDAAGRDNQDRVEQLVKTHRPDILCLQEAGKNKTIQFHSRLSPEYFASTGIALRSNCAVLSRFPLRQIFSNEGRKKKNWPRYATCLIDLPSSPESEQSSSRLPLSVTCVHLHPKWEPHRLRELEQVERDLQACAEIPEGITSLICGDFNSLTTSDYSPSELTAVAQIRERNRWESPRTDVTNRMKKTLGYTDAKDLCPYGLTGPLSSCRFNTRIDYVYVKGGDDDGSNVECEAEYMCHVDDRASDHNMVVADLVFARRRRKKDERDPVDK